MVGAASSIRQAIIAALAATVLVAASLLLSGPALAEDKPSWVLAEQSGQVHLVKAGISPIALTPGDVFSGGDWIQTGPDGRAVLRRGEETIVVAPNSRIGLPRENTGPFATRILQTLGTILLKVEKRAKQHFEVQTPYLTAVVKGTTFTVGIQGQRAVVHVVEGLVEVENLASGRRGLVRPGQTGSVLRNGPGEVQVDDAGAPGAAPASTAPAPAAASTQSAAASSGGAASLAPASLSSDRGTGAGTVTIKQTLGTTSLDLAKSTNGLIRTASRAMPRAVADAGKAGGLTDASSALDNTAAGGSALTTDTVLTAKPDLGSARAPAVDQVAATGARPGGISSPAVGRIATVNSGLGSDGGFAAGQDLGVNTPLGETPAGSNGNAYGHDKGKARGNANGHNK